jgi:hypothetical protein
MAANTAQLVERFLALYGPKELSDLLMGESRFSSDANPGDPVDGDLVEHRNRNILKTGALYHLKYAHLAGRWDGEPIKVGKHVHGADKAAFQRWLDAGAPGVFEPELRNAIEAQQA